MLIITLSKKHIILIFLLICALVCGGAVMTTSSLSIEENKDSTPLLIVMYHNVLKDTSKCGKYTITPDTFEQDVQYLINNGYTFVGCNDIIGCLYKGNQMPEKPVIITFDDGYYNNYTYIYPILQKYKIKAVISPIAIEAEKFTMSPDPNPAYSTMTWDNIKEMCDSGYVEVQNHSYNMHRISKDARGCAELPGESRQKYKERLCADLTQAHNMIFSNTGYTPQCMVYPFGMVSKGATEVIQQLGYKMSLSCTEGISYITSDKDCLFMLKRNNRPYGVSSEEFFTKIKK